MKQEIKEMFDTLRKMENKKKNILEIRGQNGTRDKSQFILFN